MKRPQSHHLDHRTFGHVAETMTDFWLGMFSATAQGAATFSRHLRRKKDDTSLPKAVVDAATAAAAAALEKASEAAAAAAEELVQAPTSEGVE
jgi:hypothetical protein